RRHMIWPHDWSSYLCSSDLVIKPSWYSSALGAQLTWKLPLGLLNTANMISRPNGSVQVSCAPSAEEYQDGLIPRNWNIRPTPRPNSSPGMIRLKMAI